MIIFIQQYILGLVARLKIKTTVWNSLPSSIRDSSSTHTFRRLLKAHCFQQAFGSL